MVSLVGKYLLLAETSAVCHHNTLLIYGSLAVPTLDNWNKVAHASTGMSVVASLIMGASGYMIFVSTVCFWLGLAERQAAPADGCDARQHLEQLSFRSCASLAGRRRAIADCSCRLLG